MDGYCEEADMLCDAEEVKAERDTLKETLIWLISSTETYCTIKCDRNDCGDDECIRQHIREAIK